MVYLSLFVKLSLGDLYEETHIEHSTENIISCQLLCSIFELATTKYALNTLNFNNIFLKDILTKKKCINSIGNILLISGGLLPLIDF